MNPCDPRTLSQYLDGALMLADRYELERHLRRCRECAAELEELRRIDRMLAEWGSRRMPVPAATQQRISRSVVRRRRLPRLIAVSRMVPAAVGTSVAAVLVMLSVNVGILVQSPTVQVATPGGQYSAQLRHQSQLLANSRRTFAILSGHVVVEAPPVTTHRSQLANVY